MLEIYRAVSNQERIGALGGRPIVPRRTARLPANVPFFVDNIWEWLRPDEFPSRRRAVFGSPATNHAHMGVSTNDSEYLIRRVIIIGAAKIAQIKQRDAKEHPDIRAITKLMINFFGTDNASASSDWRRSAAPLFLPGVSKLEFNSAFCEFAGGAELASQIRGCSQFWQGAVLLDRKSPAKYPEGEIFFESEDGYRLEQP